MQGVVPFVDADCGGRQDMVVTGCSFGAYHAVNLALRHADLFPLAIGLSGVYDLSVLGWGERGDVRSTSTTRSGRSAPPSGDHLAWLRSRLSLLLVAGQGQWEDTTGALDEHPRARRRSRPPRACGWRPTCGGTTCPTTGPPGGPSWPTTCPRFC